nr:immunoglobulin heavy chain junction region [Mus musculus]MBK4195736.1 immunoglobulin heavy chain junction region [Mus musculus]
CARGGYDYDVTYW